MNSILLLSFGLLVGVSALNDDLLAEMKQKVAQIGLECAESENAPEDDMIALLNKRPPKTHEGKCILFCAAKKLGIMAADGSFGKGDDEWVAKAKSDDPDFVNKLIAAFEICKPEADKESDNCEKAYVLSLCNYKEYLKSGIFKYF
ncbi:hypothetical protein ABEB36_003974 [Hypothenemus hampei]|uniref:Uncharacterized protein n=1 Tax=Hypothenemus hampei TaxID=57062 RepID=A0ABD1F4F7_HYPHA